MRQIIRKYWWWSTIKDSEPSTPVDPPESNGYVQQGYVQAGYVSKSN